MKRFFTKQFIPAVALALVSLAVFSACTKNYYGVEVDPYYYKVLKSDFKWDEDLRRWQISFRDSSLTQYQLEELEIAGTVIFGTGNNSNFCPLPYVDSFYVDGTGPLIVETIGYEVTYGKVTLFIQTNDKDVTRDLMYDVYEFKISLFY